MQYDSPFIDLPSHLAADQGMTLPRPIELKQASWSKDLIIVIPRIAVLISPRPNYTRRVIWAQSGGDRPSLFPIVYPGKELLRNQIAHFQIPAIQLTKHRRPIANESEPRCKK